MGKTFGQSEQAHIVQVAADTFADPALPFKNAVALRHVTLGLRRADGAVNTYRQVLQLIGTGRQPYLRSVLCPTSMMYPSGSRM